MITTLKLHAPVKFIIPLRCFGIINYQVVPRTSPSLLVSWRKTSVSSKLFYQTRSNWKENFCSMEKPFESVCMFGLVAFINSVVDLRNCNERAKREQKNSMKSCKLCIWLGRITFLSANFSHNFPLRVL